MDFPTTETEIMALCNRMVYGYHLYAADFPRAFRSILMSRRSSYNTAKKNLNQTRANLRIATRDTKEKLLELKKMMKNCLQKSEVDVAGNPEKLKLIGWGPRTESQPAQLPNQPTNLQIIAKADRTIKLKWDSPTDGQRVRNFLLEHRQQNGNGISEWRIYCISYQTQISLTNQPVGVHLEYRIKTVNIAGQSSPSNIAAIVL